VFEKEKAIESEELKILKRRHEFARIKDLIVREKY
jgi:hypothetical protein